mmetsp:Transcript_6818/g.10119  ORF Transcript_6818/g.10119 Transcript_6818/m.10119 type:complete len:309 (+) Transcript_6818:43-969(+)
MMAARTFSFHLIVLMVFIQSIVASMPAPFTRELSVTKPEMTGNDVLIAQTLLLRDTAVLSDPSSSGLTADGIYGSVSAAATAVFQSSQLITSTGVLDEVTAQKLLDLHSADNYKDSGFSAASMGYLYKIHIPVHKNRSIETFATLYDKDNNIVMVFKSRQHGHRAQGDSKWPDFGNGDIGLIEFASNGNTVTGLVEMDLNSPEPNPALYGPWPVNRVVRGLDGNAKLLLPNIRDGILIHTGNWTTDTVDWNPTMDMANSAGCVHAHPAQVERLFSSLVKLGVEVRPNPFSGRNYPYVPQGVGVIELID